MKTVFKIFLILVVISGIGYWIYSHLSKVEGDYNGPIAVTNFEKQIQKKANNFISDRDVKVAYDNFRNILSEIKTEASIVLKDGNRMLSEKEVDKAIRIIYYEYIPIFLDYSHSYFSKVSWSDSDLKFILENSELMLSLNIAESGTDAYRILNNNMSIIKDYNSAISLADRATYCTSIEDIKDLNLKINDYKYSPLTNNQDLMSKLNMAECEAKDAVVKYFTYKANIVLNKGIRGYHGDYSIFFSDYNSVLGMFNSYEKEFGTIGEFSSLRRKLNDLDDDFIEFDN